MPFVEPLSVFLIKVQQQYICTYACNRLTIPRSIKLVCLETAIILGTLRSTALVLLSMGPHYTGRGGEERAAGHGQTPPGKVFVKPALHRRAWGWPRNRGTVTSCCRAPWCGPWFPGAGY